MAKIVIVGAGSGFGSRLSIDIMSKETLKDSTICLCDLHEGRLAKVTEYVRNTIEKYNLPTRIESGTDRTKFLPGADFVITSVSVGGGAYYGYPYNIEVEIPRKYGIEQAVADTYSVGAAFRFWRTAPVQLQIVRDMEKYCPNAYLLNHTNPMVGLTMVHSLASGIRNVGICHGVQGTAHELCALLGLEDGQVRFRAAGLNHLAWFLEFKHKNGEDLYPRLNRVLDDAADEKTKAFLEKEFVRVTLMRNFGCFPTESNVHDSEYLPYFRRTPELMAAHKLVPREAVPDTAPKDRQWLADGQGGQKLAGELQASNEYTSGIMEGIVTNVPFAFNGNVMNDGLITNLPRKLCVEVPCFADSNGVNPTVIGDLPTHLAGMNHSAGVCVQLAVEALLERDREKAFYAVALDPNVAAMLPLDRIHSLFDEMWEAEGCLMEYFDKGYVEERYAKD